ncbi:hypothetical protein N657DRAFT_581301 [Parathielavia appendiculata]|uniref:Zn(2)-C6 fungal-type domain-containing protein n=1 Tax=Parathielavia appendiculata TaxID=2587402 RepID=A0AAN6YZT3_9PEZI|nr:hypothetical protein N657DRAFT_581301 [Parathielavia appendiculata]
MTSFPSRIHRPRKTCIQCAKAKRKCDRTSLSCLRCRERGMRCVYPSRLIFRDGSEPTVAAPDTAEVGRDSDRASNRALLMGTCSSPTYPPLADAVQEPGNHVSFTDVIETTLSSRWFLHPQTWIRQHGWATPQYELPVSEKSLPHFISKLKRWADDWVRDGHSPIMHRLTYEGYTPECVEDAYTSLAAYNAASPSAKPTALRVIESRVNKLLISQTQEDVDGISSAFILNTCIHLARTQALFIYQLIRLFDGDIRARVQAESHMDILNRWSNQMIESAQLDYAAADLVLSQSASTSSTMTVTTTTNNPFSVPPSAPPPVLHKAWLLSESIRRIYIASIFMQAVYNTLRRGWSVCPGAIAYTAQSGLWDARECYTWARALRRGRDPGGQKIRERGDDAPQARDGGEQELLSPWVDEFAVAVAEISCGVERVEQWVFEKGGE